MFCHQLASYCEGKGVTKVIFPKGRPSPIDLLHVRIHRNIIKRGHDNSFKEVVLWESWGQLGGTVRNNKDNT